MRTFLLTIFVAVAFPLAAAAQINAPGTRYSAKLKECDATSASAYFRGTMQTFKGANAGLEMAFTLQTQTDDGKFGSAGAPGFGDWLVAKPGIKKFVYGKTVANLSVGQTYRTLVRFRWRGPDGSIVARGSQKTKACTLPAANLNITGIMGGAPEADGTRAYTVSYLNDGDADTGPFGVDLSVGTAMLPEETDILGAGEKGSTTFTGPACVAGSMLVATLDPAGLVPESNEADNRYELPCPNVTAPASS